MYELNRARLVGIGPRGARYTDVTLDLSGLGEPIAARDLFDATTRRPSPSTLLMLDNGGGKSVLLKLLFSVVLPGRRKTVGGGSLDKFVLAGDVGHVALEWMHVLTGERLVTAKVYQRRARTASNSNPLTEGWYSFRPGDGIGLAALPTAAGDRRRTLDGYHDALDDANRDHPATQLAWLGDDQKAWRAHLRTAGIEPDLFDIQRSMNVDEGDAANAFKFTSSKAFVDWLLTTVTDPEDAASVAATFEQWATNLAQREQMLAERDFLEGAIAGLDPLADTQQAATAAGQAAGAAVRSATTLTTALTSAHDLEAARVARLTGEQDEAKALLAAREGERDVTRQVVNEVVLSTLRLDLAAASDELGQVRAELDSVNLELAGWDTVTVIQDRDEADAAARALATGCSCQGLSGHGAVTRGVGRRLSLVG